MEIKVKTGEMTKGSKTAQNRSKDFGVYRCTNDGQESEYGAFIQARRASNESGTEAKTENVCMRHACTPPPRCRPRHPLPPPLMRACVRAYPRVCVCDDICDSTPHPAHPISAEGVKNFPSLGFDSLRPMRQNLQATCYTFPLHIIYN